MQIHENHLWRHAALWLLVCMLLGVLLPDIASAIIGGGPVSPEVLAQRERINADFQAAVSTPFWYWIVLSVAVLGATGVIRCQAWAKQIQLSILQLVIPVLGLLATLAAHFWIRYRVLDMLFALTCLTEHSPAFLIKLPFLLGSSMTGAFVIAFVWLVTHPCYIFLFCKNKKWASLSLCYLPAFAVSVAFLFGSAFAFVTAFTLVG